MRTIIVVATCKKVSKNIPSIGEFAFHGFYAGEEISRLKIMAVPGEKWLRNEDYVIYVKVLIISDKHLTGEALKCKKLNEIFIRN
jgi:hypothetical protein